MSDWYLTTEELRMEVAKALELNEPYSWGVDDYRHVADAATSKVLEALKAQGLATPCTLKDLAEFMLIWDTPGHIMFAPDDKGQS